MLTLLVVRAIIKNMHRFLVDRIQGNTAVLTDVAQLHHIRDVLRLKINNKVIVFDGAGHEFTGIITSINKKQVALKVTPLQKQRNSRAALTIACAIPKGSHMDDIIDCLTQLGVARIIPMRTERVVVKLDAAKSETRLKRWQKIAQSAAQQCQRNEIPIIAPLTDIKKVIVDSRSFDLKLIPHLSGERQLIKDVLSKKGYKNIIVLIGPEGDFTPAEVEFALHNGFIPISLGDTVLRVATAAIVAAAYIRLALDK
ncbi:MAG: RsmE family RNA methyltransferase [Dehalococcoidales bacterium]